MLKGPRKNSDISERIIECQEDLEPVVHNIVEIAMGVGWTELEICLALVEIADHRILSAQANDNTAASIRDAIARYLRRGPPK